MNKNPKVDAYMQELENPLKDIWEQIRDIDHLHAITGDVEHLRFQYAMVCSQKTNYQCS